jgi:Lipopolysaccharide-assembly
MKCEDRSRRGRARRAPVVVVLCVAFLSAGCNYSFVAGSFPPPHVRTIAIVPFENETARFELTGELYDQLLRNLPGALGIRTAGEDVADAIVRGSINRYDVVAPNYRAGDPGEAARVLQRQVNISVSVQIVDLVENVILWESTNVTALGEFPEGSPEEGGRLRAIELLVQEIVDGAQSNW